MEESASLIIDRLWIGGEGAANSSQFFEKEDIKACINCTPSILNNFSSYGVEYLRIPVNDTNDKEDIELMKQMLDLAIEWLYIHHQKFGFNVLVHCHQGINRSATVVAAYLMKYYNMKYRDVVDFLILRRQCIFYNGDKPTFKKILEKYSD